MVAPILPVELTDAEVVRRGRRILGPVSLRLEGEGVTIVMGPNGSGKTTLLRALHGLERLRGGTLRWQGERDQVRAAQAFVFQSPILMRRNVVDSIAYPLRLRGLTRRAARAAAAAEAARVGLGEMLDRDAEVLSGGERQKLALARALVLRPQVLFLDEPCANLDPHATRDIEAILREECARGTRIVMSTHHVGQARRLADEIVFLSDGRILEHAPADAFLAAPRTAEARAHLDGDLPPPRTVANAAAAAAGGAVAGIDMTRSRRRNRQ